MVDDVTRLDNTSVAPNRTLHYHYTLVNSDETIDAAKLIAAATPILQEAYRTKPELKVFRDNGVIFEYDYYYENGAPIAQIAIDPSELQAAYVKQLQSEAIKRMLDEANKKLVSDAINHAETSFLTNASTIQTVNMDKAMKEIDATADQMHKSVIESLERPPLFSQKPLDEYVKGFNNTLKLEVDSYSKAEKRVEEPGTFSLSPTTLSVVNKCLIPLASTKECASDIVHFLTNVDTIYANGMKDQHFSDQDIQKTITAFHSSTKVDLLTKYWKANEALDIDYIAYFSRLHDTWGTWEVQDNQVVFTDYSQTQYINALKEDIQKNLELGQALQGEMAK
jgi:hypothetical protein